MRARAIFLGLIACAGCADILGGSFDDAKVEPEPLSDEELVELICAKMLEVSCDEEPTELECQQSLNDQRTEASKSGCESEQSAYLDCAHDQPMTCSVGDEKPSQPVLSTVCTPFLNALEACTGGAECNSGSTGQPDADVDAGPSCWIDCADYGGECNPGSSELACQCTKGPNEGTAFTAPDCFAIGDLVELHCR